MNDLQGLNRRLKLSGENLGKNEKELDMNELMFNHTKFEVRDGEVGDGISPNKKDRKSKENTVENETQKIKARKILQTFDFNKLFYPKS